MTPEQVKALLTGLEAIREQREARLALLKEKGKLAPLLDLSEKSPTGSSQINRQKYPSEYEEEAQLRAAIRTLDLEINEQINQITSTAPNQDELPTQESISDKIKSGLKKEEVKLAAAARTTYAATTPNAVIKNLEGLVEARRKLLGALDGTSPDLVKLEEQYIQTTRIPVQPKLTIFTPERRREEISLIATWNALGDSFVSNLNQHKVQHHKGMIQTLLNSLDEESPNLDKLEEQFIQAIEDAPKNHDIDKLKEQFTDKLNALKIEALQAIVDRQENRLALLSDETIALDDIKNQDDALLDYDTVIALQTRPIDTNVQDGQVRGKIIDLRDQIQLKLNERKQEASIQHLKTRIETREKLLALLRKKPSNLDELQQQFNQTSYDTSALKQSNLRDSFESLGFQFDMELHLLKEERLNIQKEEEKARTTKKEKRLIQKVIREQMIQPREALFKALKTLENPMELNTVQDTRDSARTTRLLKRKLFPPELREQLKALDQKIDARKQDLKKQQASIILEQNITRHMIEPREKLLRKLESINSVDVDTVEDPRNPTPTAGMQHRDVPQALTEKINNLDVMIAAKFGQLRADPTYRAKMRKIIKEKFTLSRLEQVTETLETREKELKNIKRFSSLTRDNPAAGALIEEVADLKIRKNTLVVFLALKERVQQSEVYLEQLNASNPIDYDDIEDTRSKDPLPPIEMPEGTQERRMEFILRDDLEALDAQIKTQQDELSTQPMAGGTVPEVEDNIGKTEDLFKNLNKVIARIQGDLEGYKNKDSKSYKSGYDNAKESLEKLQQALNAHKEEYIQSLKAPQVEGEKPVTYKALEAACTTTMFHFVGDIRTTARKEMPQSRYKQFKQALQSLASWFSDSFKNVPPSQTYKESITKFIAQQETGQDENQENRPPSNQSGKKT
jgi:hypothetical protein